jgi:hypothetical protein
MNDQNRQAPRAEVADRRQGHIIAKLLGTLALASFLLMISAGTARALGIGEIVDESPLDPVTETVENVTEPVTDIIEEPVTQVAEAVEPVTEAVEPLTEPVEDVTETVAEAAEPVTEPVEEVTETVTRAAKPVTEVVAAVTETVTETIDQPLTEVTGTVGSVLEEVKEPIEPVLDVIDETVEGTTEIIGGVTTPVLDGVDDLVDPALPSIPAPDGATDGGSSGSDPDPVMGPRSPDSPVDISNPGEPPATSDGPMTTPVLVPAPSFLTTPPSGVPRGQTEAEGGSTRESPPTPITMADAVEGGGSLGDEGSPVGEDPSPRALARPAASGSSSSSGSVSSLLAVIVLLGLIAPRLSRWLRSLPVLWRPYALAEALELPG